MGRLWLFLAIGMGLLGTVQTTSVTTLNAQARALCAMASAMGTGLTTSSEDGTADQWSTLPKCATVTDPSTKPVWCGWKGITCDGNSSSSPPTFLVTSIALSDHSLNGTLPAAAMTALNASLMSLDLGRNALSKTLPAQLGALTALTYLNLAFNSFTGGIPAGWSRLTLLQELDVASTYLNATVPSQIGLLTSLTRLSLSATGIPVGSISNGLSRLANLQILDMR